MGSFIVFIILAAIAIGAAIGMLISKSAVHSALFLVLNFGAIAIFYLVLNAPFIAMVQITVYAGAIMVLFLFVIMLLGAEQLRGALGVALGAEMWQRILAGLLTAGLLAAFLLALAQKGGAAVSSAGYIDTSPFALGLRLFAAYLFPFEVTGVLLLVAMIGVVIFSQKKKGDSNA